MKRLTLVAFFIASTLSATNRYVSTTGTAGGDGTIGNPWTLSLGLSQDNAHVVPGDTLYLRGGVYTSANMGPCNSDSLGYKGMQVGLQGNSGAHITVSSAPGEWAEINMQNCGAGLNVGGTPRSASYVDFRDFEIYSTGGRASFDIHGVHLSQGDHIRFINLVIHDATSGSGFNTQPAGAQFIELISSFISYNGPTNSNQYHGIYFRNSSPSIKATDNIVFNNSCVGIQAQNHTTDGVMPGLVVQGNIAFNNAFLNTTQTRNPSCHGNPHYFGNDGSPSAYLDTPLIDSNIDWIQGGNDGTTGGHNWGVVGGCQNATVTNNLLYGPVSWKNCLNGLTQTGNTFYVSNISTKLLNYPTWNATPTPFPTATYPTNTYTTSTPGSPWIFVRAHSIDAGRGNVAIANWQLASTVNVDISPIVTVGHSWSLYWAGNYRGPIKSSPVQTGTNYAGGTVAINTQTVYAMAAPLGTPTYATPASPAPNFYAFLLVDTGGAGPTPTFTPSTTPSWSATPTNTPTATLTPTPTATANTGGQCLYWHPATNLGPGYYAYEACGLTWSHIHATTTPLPTPP